jgi:hypothetical protein
MNGLLKSRRFILLLILVSLFSQIASSSVEDFNIYQKKEFTYTLSSFQSNYVVYTVTGDETSKYVLSAYADSSRQKRIQLAQSFKGEAKIYLSISDFANTLYLDLECSEYPCKGSLEYDSCESFELKDGEPINYYVNKDNEEIFFSINLIRGKSNVWARGEYEISAMIDKVPIARKEIGNSGIILLIDNNNDYMNQATFTVKAKKGDYINVGYISFKDAGDFYETTSTLKIDGPSITGFLKKQYLKTVCYQIENYKTMESALLIGNGIVFTKFGYSYLAKEDGTILPSEDIINSGYIRNGIIISPDMNEQYKVCISFPDSVSSKYSNIDEIVFTYQINNVIQKEMISSDPQLNGFLYSRTINENSKVAYISQKNGQFNKMTLNLNSILGFPKMYVVECENFPLCKLDDETLQKSIRPRNINRFSSYNVQKKEDFDDSPISKKQTLFVVECVDIENREGSSIPKYMDYICDFNSLIYDDDPESVIELRDNKFFNQYALINEQHRYKINLSKEPGIQKVFIDIMTYVGEIIINTDGITSKGIRADQYESINKIFLSVKVEEKAIDEISFTINATDNAYYTILVTYANNKNDEDSYITNNLQSGMAYLVTVDNNKKSEYDSANKVIKFNNERMFDQMPFAVNFYSLNCEISVGILDETGKEVQIKQFEYFSHDIIYKDDQRYIQSPYEYRIRVKNRDPSEYVQNLCKIYASSVELSEKHDDFTRDILIPDNIDQQFMFGAESRHISIGYIHVDFHNDLLVSFNLKHIAKYKVQFYFENHVRQEEPITIAATNMLFIKSKDWENICKDNSRVCYIQIDITLEEIKDNENPVLEFSVRSIGTNYVDYLPKNHLRTDYVQNNIPQYYFTELGVNENGFILANFLRGSGTVYARVVRKNLENPEDAAIWRGKYNLPNEENTLMIDPFTKKLSFATLEECEDGCFLILSVFSDVKSNKVAIDKNFPFTIMISTYPTSINYLNIPSIRIPVDEYIVGAINRSKTLITEYYSVWLNSDADAVLIDFQAHVGGIYINVGDSKPIIDSSHFKFLNSGKATLHTITRDEIRKVINEKGINHDFSKKGLRDLVLTIGVWTNLIDSIFTTPFSFAVRLISNQLEIYRVNSDQKVLCNPTKLNDNNYRCLYVIDYDFIHQFQGVFIYANPQDKTVNLNLYASIIKAVDYEMGSLETIKNLIPDENSRYSTKEEKEDFLYISEGTNINEYIIVSVEVNKKTTIELLSTIFLYQDSISPNPSSSQLFSSYTDYAFKLDFPNEYMVMVNIICVGGSGEVYWDDNNKYYLKGRDDRLSITSLRSENEHELTIKGTGALQKANGFVFIVEYNIREDLANFDALDIFKSVNYVYTESDFPIVLYCPLDSFDLVGNDYYDVSVNYYDLEIIEEKPLTYYETYPFIMHGFIVRESTIFDSKLHPEITPAENEDTIFGYYDHAVRTSLIRIKAENIKASKITDEKPYLYLKLDKSDFFMNIRKYKTISFETSVFHKESQIPVSEQSNQFGFLDISQNDVKYILRNDNAKPYMNLEFSGDLEDLEMGLDNVKMNLEQTKYGKQFYSIETNGSPDLITLNIKRKSGKDSNTLQFFYFKYTFSENKVNSNYEISNTKIQVTQTYGERTSNYTVELTPITNHDQYNSTYIVRLITDKKMPSNPNIAMRIGIQNVKEYYSPKLEGNKMKIPIYDAAFKIEYMQVIVQIRDKEKVDYLSYDLQNKFTETNQPPSKDRENGTTEKTNKGALVAGIVIGAFLLIIVVILIIIIFIFNNKNKDLLEQVNKVSFADPDQRGEGEDLLLDRNK